MSRTEPPSDAQPSSPPGRRRATVLTLLALLGLLGLTAAVMGWAWVEIGDVEFTTHGWVALGLGAGLTFLVGALLMGLVFFSSRRGYDERAHDWSKDRGRPARGPGAER